MRRAVLAALLEEHGFGLVDLPTGGLAIDRGGRRLVEADWMGGHLRVGDLVVHGREDALDYDGIDPVLHPLEPDLLLLHQAATTGVRIVVAGGGGQPWCTVSSPSRLAWPPEHPECAHPSTLDPERAWAWPWDPIMTTGELAEPPEAVITDIPALCPPPDLVRGLPNADYLVRCTGLLDDAARRAAGLQLNRLPGERDAWVVSGGGAELGVALFDAVGDASELELIGAVEHRRVRGRALRRPPWTEVFDRPIGRPAYAVHELA